MFWKRPEKSEPRSAAEDPPLGCGACSAILPSNLKDLISRSQSSGSCLVTVLVEPELELEPEPLTLPAADPVVLPEDCVAAAAAVGSLLLLPFFSALESSPPQAAI